MATDEEIERRVAETDTPRTAKRSSAAKRVGELVRGPCVVAFKDNSLRQAINLMAREGVGRVPVVERDNPGKLVAILSHSDVRGAIRAWLEESEQAQQTLRWRALI